MSLVFLFSFLVRENTEQKHFLFLRSSLVYCVVLHCRQHCANGELPLITFFILMQGCCSKTIAMVFIDKNVDWIV